MNIIRANPTHQSQILALWMALQAECETLDERYRLSVDAHLRIKNDLPIWLKSEECAFYIAQIDNEIVGFTAAFVWTPEPLYIQKDEIYIRDLYVKPAFRRQKIAQKLVHSLENWAQDLGIEQMRLGTLSHNTLALQFWENSGFSILLTYLHKTLSTQNVT